jgi:hypothetical protein
MRKSLLQNCFISEGRFEYTNNLFTNEVPRRIIIGLVDHDAYNGHNKKSPFDFKNFDVQQISIMCSGRTFPYTQYNLEYGVNKYSRPYHDMCENLSLGMFKRGWNIYVFNLTNSLDNEPGFELIKDGTTSINIKFRSRTPNGGITLIAYGEVDSLLLVDKNRHITSDIAI